MTETDIRPLLDRYYEAQTTPQEEETLKRYFLTADVPASLMADKQLFMAFSTTTTDVPHDLEQRLERSIDQWNMVEKHTDRHARTVSMRWIAGMAASMALLFTLGTYLNTRSITATQTVAASMTETYDNPKDAASETERALTKFSIALNKGLKKMGQSARN